MPDNSIETAPMKDSELGQFVCVIHPQEGCLHSPHITINSGGVWVKTSTLWSSGHADCVQAYIAAEQSDPATRQEQ